MRWNQDHVQCHTYRQHTVLKAYLQPSHLNAYYSLDSSKTSYKTRDLGLDLKNKNSSKLNNENVIMFILYQESQGRCFNGIKLNPLRPLFLSI